MSSNVPTPALPMMPAARITADGGLLPLAEEVPLDLRSNNTFSVSYASSSRTSPLVPFDRPSDLSEPLLDDLSPRSTRSELPPTGTKEFFPQFSRSESMPLPSQLSQLQHPHKPTLRESVTPRSDTPSSVSSSPSAAAGGVQELSVELADSIQMVVQTLLQVSPPQVLDITKEQFSACSLSVPTSSMSAMFTVMKNINYLSAHMPCYFEDPPLGGSIGGLLEQDLHRRDGTRMEFDIGETLQCVGDSLSGTAAQAGVDLVIYHGDVGLKHVNVFGDEAGISYAISHVIRQIISTAIRHDTIELGLLLVPSQPPKEGATSSSPDEASLQCTIRLSHRFCFPEREANAPYGPEPEQVRQRPNFSSLLLRRILRHTAGSLKEGLPPPEGYGSGRTVELVFPLRRPRAPQSNTEELPSEDPQFQHDPTLRDLVTFAETLKGKKVTLYASPEACFAQHLTSYLTAWGMDVTHVSPDGNVDGSTDASAAADGGPTVVDAKIGDGEPASFVFIDDDIDVLKERLVSHRTGPSHILNKKRPPLSTLHRPRSTLNVPHAPTPSNNQKSSVVIMHFTSLSNYKHLKDVVQSIMASYSAQTMTLPEVMILPKPAGPRRFLTALHTAATKPSVELPFIPLATSPLSPGLATGSFFGTSSVNEPQPLAKSNSSQKTAPSQPVSPTKPVRPSGSRTNSDRSLKSRDSGESGNPSVVTPSPLSIPDNAEYFASAARNLGSTPSSGMVIQSPDGQSAGILFTPKARASRSTSNADRSQLSTSLSRRKSRASPSLVNEGGPSFSSLYAATASRTASPSSKFKLLRDDSAEASTSTTSAAAAAAALAIAAGSPRPVLPKLDSESPVSPAQSPKMLSAKDKGKGKASSPSTSPRAEGPASLRKRHLRKMSQQDKENPATPGAAPMKGPKPAESSVTPPISVLIVDDNPINQTILSTFMKRKKIKFDIANNGEEAVHKWRSGGFHLILMDIQMPVMDGIQATKEIRRLEKVNALAGYPPLSSPSSTSGSRTPSDVISGLDYRGASSPYRSSVIIVALTASSLQSDRDVALAAGCNDFLTKPVSLIWLNNKIIEWGSIKALQVWADIRPDVSRMNVGQAAQAKAVAERLKVPKQSKKTPSPTVTPRRTSSLSTEEGAAALALASTAGDMAQAWKNIFTKGSSSKVEGSPEPMSLSGELEKAEPARKGSMDSTSDDDSTTGESTGSQSSAEGDNDEQSERTPVDTTPSAPIPEPESASLYPEPSPGECTPSDDTSPTPVPKSSDTDPTPTPTVPTPPNEAADPER